MICRVPVASPFFFLLLLSSQEWRTITPPYGQRPCIVHKSRVPRTPAQGPGSQELYSPATVICDMTMSSSPGLVAKRPGFISLLQSAGCKPLPLPVQTTTLLSMPLPSHGGGAPFMTFLPRPLVPNGVGVPFTRPNTAATFGLGLGPVVRSAFASGPGCRHGTGVASRWGGPSAFACAAGCDALTYGCVGDTWTPASGPGNGGK